MVCGIYCYRDTQNDNKVVYVGKDCYIHLNKRFREHMHPSRYNEQVINRVLQNNPNRYIYQVLKEGDFSENLLNALEIIYTRKYNPKFNFTIGGDGKRGYKHSEETKKKISDSLMGHYVSYETRVKLSEAKKGKNHPNYRDDIPSGEELYLLSKSGLSYQKIGEKYNCHRLTVSNRIKRYKEGVEL